MGHLQRSFRSPQKPCTAQNCRLALVCQCSIQDDRCVRARTCFPLSLQCHRTLNRRRGIPALWNFYGKPSLSSAKLVLHSAMTRAPKKKWWHNLFTAWRQCRIPGGWTMCMRWNLKLYVRNHFYRVINIAQKMQITIVGGCNCDRFLLLLDRLLFLGGFRQLTDHHQVMVYARDNAHYRSHPNLSHFHFFYNRTNLVIQSIPLRLNLVSFACFCIRLFCFYTPIPVEWSEPVGLIHCMLLLIV